MNILLLLFLLTAQAQTQKRLQVPINFIIFQEPKSSPLLSHEDELKEIARLNQYWDRCGIEFSLKSSKLVQLGNVKELQIPESYLNAYDSQFYQLAGKPNGSSSFYEHYKVYFQALFSSQNFLYDQFYPEASEREKELQIFIVPNAKYLGNVPPSFTHAGISNEGATEEYYFGSQELHFEHTYGITHAPGAGSFGIAQPNVLLHETGHYLGLNHVSSGQNNIMSGSGLTNETGINRAQCEYSRGFLERKLGIENPVDQACKEHLHSIVEAEDQTVSLSSFFERLDRTYDSLPSGLKQRLCSYVNKIKLSDHGLGLGETTQVEGGYGIRLNSKFLKPFLRIQDALTFKEQLSFGGEQSIQADHFERDPTIIGIGYTPSFGSNDYLSYILVHELAHVIDFTENVNARFAQFSWQANNSSSPLPQNDFFGRTKFCYYWCKSNPLSSSFISTSDTQRIYKELLNTNFVSTYAAQDSREDFAETLTYAVLLQKSYSNISLYFPSANIYTDMNQHYQSDLLKEKREFVEQFLFQ